MAPHPQSASRVLRIAVVVDELVCGQLHQTAPGPVTLGHSYRADLMVHGRTAPELHRVFDVQAGGYYLDLPPLAKGKLKLAGRPITVGALRKKLGQPDGRVRVRLDARAKGKLKLGESIVMFQFDRPKPIPPKLPFPTIFKASVLSMVGALFLYSQLASAGLLGPFFLWATFAEIPEDREIELEERFVVAMGVPPKKDEPELEEEEQEQDELAKEDDEKEDVEDKEKPEPKKLAEKPEKFSKQAMSEARSVGVARVLGTYGGPGEGTVFDVINDTENNLGELFAMGMTTTVLADGGDISEFVPGGEGISLHGSSVATKGFETGDGPALEAKADKRERKIVGKTKTSKTDITGGGDAKALRATIKHRTSALQHCYNKALRTQPDLAGKMTYTIFISVMGTVTKVVIEEDSLGSAAVSSCTQAKIKGWRFPMNGADEGAEVTFSVVFSGA